MAGTIQWNWDIRQRLFKIGDTSTCKNNNYYYEALTIHKNAHNIGVKHAESLQLWQKTHADIQLRSYTDNKNVDMVWDVVSPLLAETVLVVLPAPSPW